MTLIAWHDGDRSVGINGDEARVAFAGDDYDAEFTDAAKATLARAFTALWDFKARVMTEVEFNEYTKEEG